MSNQSQLHSQNQSMSQSQSQEGVERLEAMESLMEEILQIQKENRKSDETMDRVRDIIQESSRIVENSEAPHEMIIDAKILHTGTQVVSSNILAFDTNLTSFDETEYESGLLTYLENAMNTVNVDCNWECLSTATFHLFKKTAPIKYMLGTFTMEPPARKERKKVERTKKAPEAEKKVLATCEEKEKEENDENSDVYQHILKCMYRHFKRNGKKPISYLEFVIDPNDYWTTIENIFHCSFLVRDGSVKMSLENNNTGVPVVEPILGNANNSSKTSKKSRVFCLRLSMTEWRHCIEVFDIKQAMITPYTGTKKN